jgi:hypothetical protein
MDLVDIALLLFQAFLTFISLSFKTLVKKNEPVMIIQSGYSGHRKLDFLT